MKGAIMILYSVIHSMNIHHRFNISKKFERNIVNIFLPISFNICFGCSKEPSHWHGSFEYPQHMFWLRIKKNSYSFAL